MDTHRGGSGVGMHDFPHNKRLAMVGTQQGEEARSTSGGLQ